MLNTSKYLYLAKQKTMNAEYMQIFQQIIEVYDRIKKNKKLFKKIFADIGDIANDTTTVALLAIDVTHKIADPMYTRAIPKPEEECRTLDDLGTRIVTMLPPMQAEQKEVMRYIGNSELPPIKTIGVEA